MPEPSNMRRLPPALAVAYLVVLALGVFFIADLALLGALVAAQLVAGALAGMRPRQLGKPFRKLALFALLVIASYSLLGAEDLAHDQRLTVPFWPWPVSVSGFSFGCAMVLRVLAVVTASAWVRFAGSPGDFVLGFRKLGMPRSLAELLDLTLLLLESEPRGGRGDGSGRRRQGDARFSLRRVLSGDLGFVVDGLEGSIEKAARARGQATSQAQRDLVVLAGLLLLMLGIKALKVLPGIPFAPGYKGAILLPIYLLAPMLTRRRGAATLLGTAFGLLSFLFGDGRYGIFEVLKHITPGLIADAFAPLLRARMRSTAFYVCVGMLMAVGRWATIAAVVLLIEAPGMVVAVLAPVGFVHLVFGALSGMVSRVVLRGADRLTSAAARAQAVPAEPLDGGAAADAPRERHGGGRGGGGGRGDGSGGGRNREGRRSASAT